MEQGLLSRKGDRKVILLLSGQPRHHEASEAKKPATQALQCSGHLTVQCFVLFFFFFGGGIRSTHNKMQILSVMDVYFYFFFYLSPLKLTLWDVQLLDFTHPAPEQLLHPEPPLCS